MLVRNPMKVEAHCPRRWSLLTAALLLSLATVAAGVRFTHAAADETKKDNAKIDKDGTKDPSKKDDKKEEKKPEKKAEPLIPGFSDVEDLMKQLGGLDPKTAKMIRKHLEMNRKLIEQLQKKFPGGGIGGLPGNEVPPLPQLLPLLPQLKRFAAPGSTMTEPRMGASFTKPSSALVDQLDLPREQGLIVEELNDDSPAAKAGLKRHDILLELDGKPVSSDAAAFLKQMSAIKADKPVDAVVMRKTKRETIKGLKLPEAKEERIQPLLPFKFQFPNPLGGIGGAGGITTITRTNDSFTARHTDNAVTIGIKGKIEQGKAQVSEITIKAGEKTQTYDSVEKVPAEQRERVKNLIMAAETGRVRNSVRPGL